MYSGGVVACTVTKGAAKVKAFRVHFGAARGQSPEVAKAVAKSLRRVHADKLSATKTMKTERLDQWSKDLRGSSSRIQTFFVVRSILFFPFSTVRARRAHRLVVLPYPHRALTPLNVRAGRLHFSHPSPPPPPGRTGAQRRRCELRCARGAAQRVVPRTRCHPPEATRHGVPHAARLATRAAAAADSGGDQGLRPPRARRDEEDLARNFVLVVERMTVTEVTVNRSDSDLADSPTLLVDTGRPQ